LNGIFHLSPHENILTIALINIHYYIHEKIFPKNGKAMKNLPQVYKYLPTHPTELIMTAPLHVKFG
jgi:hypothetical protein